MTKKSTRNDFNHLAGSTSDSLIASLRCRWIHESSPVVEEVVNTEVDNVRLIVQELSIRAILGRATRWN